MHVTRRDTKTDRVLHGVLKEETSRGISWYDVTFKLVVNRKFRILMTTITKITKSPGNAGDGLFFLWLFHCNSIISYSPS